MAVVIDSLRRVVLLGEPPRWSLLAAGTLSSFLLLFVGYRVFKRLEKGLADVA